MRAHFQCLECTRTTPHRPEVCEVCASTEFADLRDRTVLMEPPESAPVRRSSARPKWVAFSTAFLTMLLILGVRGQILAPPVTPESLLTPTSRALGLAGTSTPTPTRQAIQTSTPRPTREVPTSTPVRTRVPATSTPYPSATPNLPQRTPRTPSDRVGPSRPEELKTPTVVAPVTTSVGPQSPTGSFASSEVGFAVSWDLPWTLAGSASNNERIGVEEQVILSNGATGVAITGTLRYSGDEQDCQATVSGAVADMARTGTFRGPIASSSRWAGSIYLSDFQLYDYQHRDGTWRRLSISCTTLVRDWSNLIVLVDFPASLYRDEPSRVQKLLDGLDVPSLNEN